MQVYTNTIIHRFRACVCVMADSFHETTKKKINPDANNQDWSLTCLYYCKQTKYCHPTKPLSQPVFQVANQSPGYHLSDLQHALHWFVAYCEAVVMSSIHIIFHIFYMRPWCIKWWNTQWAWGHLGIQQQTVDDVAKRKTIWVRCLGLPETWMSGVKMNKWMDLCCSGCQIVT